MTDVPDRLGRALRDRYTVERELGAGGMATVYLAHDLRHDRKVAVKVLRPELAAVLGAERFVQEIRTTASLQHPHILPLFDSGEAGGFLYYVMPYVEGETLRDKLNRERQLGIDEALRIATDVADALDYAHRHAVVHRDIKPENILLHDGRPVVADFGIALAVSAAAGGRMTETGLSLGTPHYMSPEQATAETELTGRSDIYSLACVLYEMLAGDPPHTGSTAHQIIMKIVTDAPRPVTELRRTVPAHVAEAIAIALEKLPADRFESASALAAALKGAVPARRAAAATTAKASAPGRWAWAGWPVGAIGLVLIGWSLFGPRGRAGPATQTMRFDLALPDSAPLAFIAEGTLGGGRRALAISPDGSRLVYAAREGTTERLYLRDLTESFGAVPIAGTEGGFNPVISPDGEWVAFFVGSELRKTPIDGGVSIVLAPVPEPWGLAWPTDERLLVAANEGGVLAWVPASGGAFRVIPKPPLVFVSNPSVLPNGRHALVEIATGYGDNRLGVTDLETGRTVAVTSGGPVAADSVDMSTTIVGWQPEYLASGHLVFAASAGLVAVGFDPETHRIEGSPVELVRDVRRDMGVHYAISADGTLVYAPGGDATVGTLAWVTRDGGVDSLGFGPQRYGTFDVAPDGARVAALVLGVTGIELWIYDLARRTEAKVPTRGTPALIRWWPDGRRIVFTELGSRPVDTPVSVRQLVESAGERDTLGIGWSIEDVATDTLRAVGQINRRNGVWILPLDRAQPPTAIDTFATAWGPVYSPDGRWISYTSSESGRYENYVVATDRPGERQKLSLAGGEEPLWSPRGNELVYRWGQELFAVPVPPPGSSTFGLPQRVYRGPFVNVPWRSHDLAPDGQRHLVVLGAPEQTTHTLRVITAWVDEVARRAGR